MKLLIIYLICLALAGCSFANRQQVFVAANVADMGTTIYGLNNGFAEGNSLAPKKQWQMVGLKVIYTAGMLVLFDRLHRENKTLATILQVGLSCVFGYVAYKNYQLIK
jgi:hypothetical protein